MAALFPSPQSDPQLYPFRSGLTFGFFNALTWQIGIGTPMVLFAEQLGATTTQVGLAYSFVFLLTPIQIVSTALLPRYGFKRVMLGGWGARSLFLAVPLVLSILAPWWGVQGWMVHALVWSVFFFCLFRSIGSAAINPWLYTILPAEARGRYFGTDQFLSGIGGVLTLLCCAGLFALLPVYPALLAQYLIAFLGSTLSYHALKQLPDAPKPTAISLRTVIRDTPRHVFARSPFRPYLWLAVWFSIISSPIPPFAAYYLKAVPRLSLGTIMLFEVFRYLGVIVAAWAVKRRIDHTGAKPFLLLALALYAAVAGYWWFFLRLESMPVAGIFVAYFLVGLGTACWSIGNLNYLPKVIPVSERTLMVSIHGAVTACLGGCAPVVCGVFLRTETSSGPGMDVGVFQIFFIGVFVSACVLSWLVARLEEDKTMTVEPLVIGNAILRPLRAATYLVNLIDLQSLRSPDSRSNSAEKR